MIIVLILIILALVGYILWLKKPKKKEIDREEIEKRKETKKAFDNLMKYDFEIAIRRK